MKRNTLILCCLSVWAWSSWCHSQETGLISRWTFDDPASLGQDLVSTNHGSVFGGAFASSSPRVGLGALAVNGIDGYVEIADSPALRFTADQSFTIVAWVYITSPPASWKGIVSKSRNNAPWYGLWISGDNLWVAGGSANINGTEVTPEWHHLVEVQDAAAGTRDLYVDGQMQASGAASDANGTGPFWIGGAASVSEYFSGLIDDVRVYSRALTPEEISQASMAPLPSTTNPITISLQPADLTVAPGEKARFSAVANALNLTGQWFKGNTPVGAPVAATWNNGGSEAILITDPLTASDQGSSYYVVFSSASGSVTSRVAQVTVTSAVFSPGFLKREVYTELSGTAITDLTGSSKYPDAPDSTVLTGLFETPTNFADNYGQRLSGFIAPSETANYIFFLAADDNAELWLSTDDSPANMKMIASEPQWNPARYWVGADRRNPDAIENRSAPIRLEAGRRYYVEALQKEGGGGDNLAVTAIKEGDPDPANGSSPLGGAFMGVMATPASQSISITNQPADVSTFELAQVTFQVGVTTSGSVPISYQWQKNGSNIFKAIESTYTTPPITTADNGAKFQCVIYLPGNVFTNSRQATVKVDMDKTPPVISGVFSLQMAGSDLGNEVYVSFDEPVEPASATNPANYSLGAGNTVNAVAMMANGRGVVLSTSDLSAGQDYILTVKNVADVAASHNRIISSSKTFQVSSLIAYYPFEDAANLGADANGANPGKSVGGATFSADSRVGTGALRVNGSNGHIEVADSPLLRFAMDQSYTVSAWIKTASVAGGWRGIVNKSRNSDPFYGLWISDGAQYVAGGNNINGPALTDGWHHMAVVQDGESGARDLYIDGVSAASGSAIAADGTGPLWIGGAAGVTEFFNGWIDDVRIYNRALSTQEINALATAAPPAPKVSLTLVKSGSNVVISWPDTATGFALEFTDKLGSGIWQTVSQPVSNSAGRFLVTLSIEAQSRCYRLKK